MTYSASLPSQKTGPPSWTVWWSKCSLPGWTIPLRVRESSGICRWVCLFLIRLSPMCLLRTELFIWIDFGGIGCESDAGNLCMCLPYTCSSWCACNPWVYGMCAGRDRPISTFLAPWIHLSPSDLWSTARWCRVLPRSSDATLTNAK